MNSNRTISLILCIFFNLICQGFTKNNLPDEILSEIVDVHVHKTRSVEIPYEVKFSAFGENYHLRLKRLESSSNDAKSIFSDGFTVTTVDVDEDGHTTKTTTSPSLEELRAAQENIFVDPQTGAALKVEPSGDKHNVDGTVGQGRTISSSPEGQHTVTQQNQQGRTIPTGRTAPMESDYQTVNRTVTPQVGRSWGDTTVQPEVLLVLDYDTTQLFKGDQQKIYDYYSIMFHFINNRFASLVDPKVQFVISGVLQVNSKAAQPFQEENRIGATDQYDILKILNAVGAWAYAQEEYGYKKDQGKHDLIAFMTSQDMKAKTAKGDYMDVSGIANLQAVCLSNFQKGIYYGVSVNEDFGGIWQGAWTIAHELAHNLGAPHDGEEKTKECDWNWGYLMSYVGWGTENQYNLSKCSIKLITDFLKSTGSTCLKSFQSASNTRWTANALNAGERMTIKEQCIKATKMAEASVDPGQPAQEYCLKLRCVYPDAKNQFMTWTKQTHGAYEGSPCGDQKQCMNGKCLDKGGQKK